MLIITKGQAGQTLIVTLNEKKTTGMLYFLFVFKSTTTSDEVLRLYYVGDDTSTYPERYNEFPIDESLFEDKAVGQYKYDVYELPTSHYGDYTALNKIECGQMELKPATEINRKGYAAQTESRKGYAG